MAYGRFMKLADYLEKHDISRTDFAAKIGKQPSYITMVCQGQFWPGRDVMERIVEITGGKVTPNDFLEETE